MSRYQLAGGGWDPPQTGPLGEQRPTLLLAEPGSETLMSSCAWALMAPGCEQPPRPPGTQLSASEASRIAKSFPGQCGVGT